MLDFEGMEYFTHEANDRDAWHCLCGNIPSSDGFYPCDKRGHEIEPVIGSGWNGLYVCASCGRIINQANLEIVGRIESPAYAAA